ncbi:Putative DNA-binding protein in cluster with Type I restriction-modification system [Alloactinosynnema sp. L-07]|uniref:helix-turn-helix domain-containing protein n=1 Tax=Alloactinosynnema sp. L-07 TaxID=1653480 RepID=UPI00065EF9BC|nr:helix-turn-helix transcriptional regulator [Alloactinosynnema sp. L-07]CRK59855.1 Putative DNA-binding protein in cluster with Type I restriction-modification system [Alloactinosynnema sp. L-07]
MAEFLAWLETVAMTTNSARMRGLAAELQDLRKAAGLTLRDVSERIGFSLAKISRLENGIRDVSVEDTATLLGVYSVKGAKRERLLDLARNLHQPHWPATGRGNLHPHLATLIAFEAMALRIIQAEMLLVPGLLQTVDYMRTVMMVHGASADRIKVLVDARLRRQDILVQARAPHYLAVIDEAAIRRPTGSAELMVAQLEHLCRMAELPNIDIHLLPFDRGHHVGLTGGFGILHFAKTAPVVHIDHENSAMFLHESEDVSLFQASIAGMLKAGLTSAESVKFLRRYQARYSRE